MPKRYIRQAQQNDAPILTGILHRAKASWGYAEEDMEIFRKHWKVTPDDIAENTVVVALNQTIIEGFAMLREEKDCFLLDHLFIEPSAHGSGWGKSLLLHVQSLASAMGKPKIRLESDGYAADFYLKHAYKITGERPSAFLNAPSIKLMENELKPQSRPR
ncbi:GNAT family N-acetyltransferase [Flexibacterium corallicola]|uniref:GNAT family N-acetyltransferase n=1 Tax=Flexibacterium corallicola TaxID=3037259 RepID=UPI00286F3538|nr:GNAT family N-acetyltransferase [Pseudovibrio sp. M1P-2-3]